MLTMLLNYIRNEKKKEKKSDEPKDWGRLGVRTSRRINR